MSPLYYGICPLKLYSFHNTQCQVSMEIWQSAVLPETFSKVPPKMYAIYIYILSFKGWNKSHKFLLLHHVATFSAEFVLSSMS